MMPRLRWTMSVSLLASLALGGWVAVGADGAGGEGDKPAPIKTLVPNRMVCSEACKARLDLANGVKRCPKCGKICNVAHKMCRQCAKKAGVCEVCGKPMAVPAPKPKERIITEKSAGKTVAAAVGEKVIIRIPSRGPGPTPPPRWTVKLKGESLKQQGEVRLRARVKPAGPGRPALVRVTQGGPMTAEAVFRAVKVGKTEVTLEARPWRNPDAKPSKTFAVTVDVRTKVAEALKLTEGHNGKTVTAEDVAKVVIELPSAPPPGVGWKVAEVDGKSLKQIGGVAFGGLKPVSGPGGLASSRRGTGKATVTFGVVALGRTTIKLEYRAAKGGRPIRTWSVTVDVRKLPPGGAAASAPRRGLRS